MIPGGMSMPILPAGQLDVPMANEFLRERKTMLGTGGVMVMDETTCMVRVACVITYFFRDESCGQCTQCREGTGWMNKIVDRIERGAGSEEDLDDPARRRGQDGGPDDLRVRRRRGLAGPGAAAPLPRASSRRTCTRSAARSRRASSSRCRASRSTDIELEVAEGRTLLQALDDVGLLMNGVDVPHYCWHPKLSIDGSCRLCQVEVEGLPKLQIACNTPVQDGMVVRTQARRACSSAREGVMELLLVNHPLDCPICDQAGECKLQDYAYEYGIAASRTREPRRALEEERRRSGPRSCSTRSAASCAGAACASAARSPRPASSRSLNRGDHSVIETFPGVPLDNDYSMNVADICPVGALTTKDFRFKIRVWFLDDVPGVCTGCANGCNIHLGVANNKVYRYVPRRNDAVNDTWICDEGRMTLQARSARPTACAARARARRARRAGGVRASGRDRSGGGAPRAAARCSKGAGVIAGIASAHATNEDLFVFRRLLEALGAERRGRGRSRAAAPTTC